MYGPIEEAKVSIEDRGFQFGDGVYEVIVVYGSRPFLADQHLDRLRTSTKAIGLRFDVDSLRPVMEEGLRRSGLDDALIYIQLTRGVSPRCHLIPDDVQPTVVLTFKPLPRLPDEIRERGVNVMTIRNTRWSQCYIKAITLLPNVLAKTEATRRGYFDAVFCTDDNEVLETTSANIFIVRKGRLLTPRRDESILHGITQGFIMECAANIGTSVAEAAVTVNDLYDADEVFLSGTTVEALAATSVDDHTIGDGTVGPVTRRIYEEFQNRVRRIRAQGKCSPPADERGGIGSGAKRGLACAPTSSHA